jgi:purine-binding chemotaxis protein CheW
MSIMETTTMATDNRRGAGTGSRDSVEILQFATFHLNREVMGINILQVQEIQQPQRVTPVPRAPSYVMGLISLRGQIIPLVDLRRRLRMDTGKPIAKPYHIVVRGASTMACFEVDQIGDVVNVPSDRYRKPPESVHAIDKRFMEGVYPMEEGILTVLNVEEVLELETV